MNTSDPTAAQVKRRTAAPLQPHHFANAESSTSAQLLATLPSASQPLEETASALLDKLAAPSDGYVSSGDVTALSSPRAMERRLRGSLGRLCNGLWRRLWLTKALRGQSSSQLLRFGLLSLITAVVLLVVHLCSMENTISLDGSSRELQYLRQPSTAPWSVLVEHTTAMERLGISPQKECHGDEDPLCTPMRVGPAFLPSWTLRVVDPACADCLDVGSYAAALNSTRLQGRQHGVFATSAAPLGRIGPMLLAMASVTDDVDVRAELPRWTWLRSVYGESFPRVPAAAGEAGDAATAGAPGATQGPPAPSYLAVMGIPSTDQPQRVALRDAQRATWLSYREVARTANDFSGALLPLYLFAAVEPDASTTVSRVDAAALAPTQKEFLAASAALLRRDTLGRDTGGGEEESHNWPSYTVRRATLRAGWAGAAAGGRGSTVQDHRSACADVRRVVVDGSPAKSAAAFVAKALALPVTPAFLAGSRFVCEASGALWQEALTHRNVIWIDLMTDRRPTTDKKIGENKKWGLPVEVGMTQKLILWLHYAYHAFANVPYIMKGDDDMYAKVPQYMRDLRHLIERAGGAAPARKHRSLRVPVRVAAACADNDTQCWGGVLNGGAAAHVDRRGSSAAWPAPVNRLQRSATAHAQDAAVAASAFPCMYRGSMRLVESTFFSGGMLFMAHRSVVRAVLEPPESPKITKKRDGNQEPVDVVRLALHDFDPALSKNYTKALFETEDIMFGLLIHDRRQRAWQLCRDGKLFYARERFSRFHDLRTGRLKPVSWETVVAHRTRPLDMHFLFHFFQAEHNTTSKEALLAAWAASVVPAVLDAGHATALLPEVLYGELAPSKPSFAVAPLDGVAVYEVAYEYFRKPLLNVFHGFIA